MKKILITGGTQGIGRALVETLAQHSYHVTFTFQNSAAAAKEICQLSPNNLTALRFDQSAAGEFENSPVFSQDWDAVVFNAALGTKTAEETSPNRYEQDLAMFKVNALGPLWMAEKLLLKFAENPAKPRKLIFISSVGGGVAAFPGFRKSDGMSKAALSFLAEQLSVELAQSPIDVITVCPGATDTPMFQKSTLTQLSEVEKQNLFNSLPKKKIIHPQEIADLIRFLIDFQPHLLHGATLDASCGLGVRPGLLTEFKK